MEASTRAAYDWLTGPSCERGPAPFLKDSAADSADWWHVAVPAGFNSALGIRYDGKPGGRRWVQGAAFDFRQGDLLYDRPQGTRPWSEALKTMGFCVRVLRAVPASGRRGPHRSRGEVQYEVWEPNEGRTVLVRSCVRETTQDGFMRFLIWGEKGDNDVTTSAQLHLVEHVAGER